MDGEGEFTTNAHDLQEAASIQARLSEYNASASSRSDGGGANAVDDDASIPSVSLDAGAYKYVLIEARTPANRPRVFVYSKRNASYHRNVAEYLLPQLEGAGYSDVRIKGGGRILRDDESKRIHIFGYSYGFGQADHQLAKDVVQQSASYREYNVTWSNDGY